MNKQRNQRFGPFWADEQKLITKLNTHTKMAV